MLFSLPNCLSDCALSSAAVPTAAVLGGRAGLSTRETGPAPELSTGDAALLGAALAGPRADLSVRQPAVGRGGHGGRRGGGGGGGGLTPPTRGGGGAGAVPLAFPPSALVGHLRAGVLTGVQPAGDHTGGITGVACNRGISSFDDI